MPKELQAGSVDEALAAIDETLAKNPSDADALALRAVIQIAKNDKAGALDSATRATVGDAANYRGWLALSYAQQASFDLGAALKSALKAESLQSESSFAHARAAELTCRSATLEVPRRPHGQPSQAIPRIAKRTASLVSCNWRKSTQ
jgi:predicted Zn-dependent protease